MRSGYAVVGVTLSALAAAVLVLPPARPVEVWPVDPLRHEENIALSQYSRRAAALRLLHGRAVAESAVARAGLNADVALWSAPDVPAATVERVRGGIARQLAALPARDSGMRLAVGIVLDTGESLAGVTVPRVSGAWRTDVAIPGTIAPDVCGVVLRVSAPYQISGPSANTRRAVEYLEHSPALLGACAWYLAYGAPGAGVARWLDSVRHLPVAGRGEAFFGSGRSRQSAAQARSPRRSPFEEELLSLAPMHACAAGRLQWCEALLLGGLDRHLFPPAVGVAGVAVDPQRAFSRTPYPALAVPRTLLSQIEREIGPDAFRRLWRSARPFDEAFLDVRGNPLGDWVHGRIVAQSGAVPSGPYPERSTTLALIVGTAGLFAIGLAGVARRSGIP
jgi:hypothetical protein